MGVLNSPLFSLHFQDHLLFPGISCHCRFSTKCLRAAFAASASRALLSFLHMGALGGSAPTLSLSRSPLFSKESLGGASGQMASWGKVSSAPGLWQRKRAPQKPLTKSEPTWEWGVVAFRVLGLGRAACRRRANKPWFVQLPCILRSQPVGTKL